jgi:hypothetical protein
MKTLSLLTPLAALSLAALPLFAGDTVSPGWSVGTQPNPAFGAAVCTLPGGDLVTFDGISIDRWSPAGTFVANLGTLPGFVFASFAVPTSDGQAIVVGDSGNGSSQTGSLYLAMADGSGTSFLLSLAFAYDAAFLPGGDLIVSAATGGFGNGNDLVRVSLAPPQATMIGHVAGASGPVAIDASGELHYATSSAAFPAPAGSSDVLRWSAAQVQAGGLTEANAALVGSGFDGAASLGIDPVTGRLYLAEVNFSLAVNRIVRVEATKVLSPVVLDSSDTLSGLQFVNLAGGAASFDAYQPETGVNLRCTVTDFASRSDVLTVKPARPVISASGPGLSGPGPITVTVTGGVPNGIARLTACPQSAITTPEKAYQLPAFLHHTGFDLSKTRRAPASVGADAQGKASYVLFNNGNLLGLNGYQFFVGTAAGTFVGSSTSVLF